MKKLSQLENKIIDFQKANYELYNFYIIDTEIWKSNLKTIEKIYKKHNLPVKTMSDIHSIEKDKRENMHYLKNIIKLFSFSLYEIEEKVEKFLEENNISWDKVVVEETDSSYATYLSEYEELEFAIADCIEDLLA